MPSDYIIVESSGTPLLEQVMVFVIKTIGKSTSEITSILSSLPSAAMGGSVAIAEDASAAWMKGLDGTWGKIGSESGGLPAGGTVGQYIKKLSAAYGDAAWENPDTTPTPNSTNLITSGGVDAALSVLGKAICVLVEGNKSETVAAVGEYVIVRNSSISGRPDGLYTAAKAIPANTAIDSTYLTAVSGGGLNALLGQIPEQLIHLGKETDYPLSAAHTEYPMGITLIYTAASTSYPYGTGTVVTIRSASARCVQFSFGNTSNSYKLRNADSNGWSAWKTYTGS